MGYVVVGVLFIFAGASGEFALRGTESSGLLMLAGAGMAVFGLFRAANPRISCRLCGVQMRRSAFEDHLHKSHPAEGVVFDAVQAAEGRASANLQAASATHELLIHDPGPKRAKVVKLVEESFGMDRAAAEAALDDPIRGTFATVEGARIAVEGAGATASTRQREAGDRH